MCMGDRILERLPGRSSSCPRTVPWQNHGQSLAAPLGIKQPVDNTCGS